MKKAAAAASTTGDGHLVLYSELNFNGDSKKLTDSEISLKSCWGKPIKSLIIEGNPWSFYPEENMKVFII